MLVLRICRWEASATKPGSSCRTFRPGWWFSYFRDCLKRDVCGGEKNISVYNVASFLAAQLLMVSHGRSSIS